MVNILDKKMNNQSLDQSANTSQGLGNQTLNNSLDSHQTKQDKEEGGLMSILGECLTFAPLVYEKWSGKKLPAMGGTMGEMQNALQQIATSLAQVINNQQQIYQRITNLEVSASKQLTNLVSQVQSIQSVKLTYEKESKGIEYNKPARLENNQEY